MDNGENFPRLTALDNDGPGGSLGERWTELCAARVLYRRLRRRRPILSRSEPPVRDTTLYESTGATSAAGFPPRINKTSFDSRPYDTGDTLNSTLTAPALTLQERPQRFDNVQIHYCSGAPMLKALYCSGPICIHKLVERAH